MHTLSGSGAKSHEMANNNPLLPVNAVYSLHTVEYQLGAFSTLNSLDTSVQDMKSCPTRALEISKIYNGLIRLVPDFKHVNRACPTRVR